MPTRLTFLTLLMISFICLVSCQNLPNSANSDPKQSNSNSSQNVDEQNEHDNEQTSESPNQTDSNNEHNEPQENPENDEPSAGTDDIEEQPKYVVNPNHYRIQPYTDESSTTTEHQKIVLLTIDDTPTGEHTEDILDTLDQFNAQAIFFINGHYAVRNEQLLTEIHARGHTIGNHTWWHKNLRDIDEETMYDEIVGLNDYVEELLGERPVYFRPPFGVNSDVSRKIIAEEGMQTMNWSLGSLDWDPVVSQSVEKVTSQVLDNLHNGANILFHDKKVTAEALPDILQALTAEGYQFVVPTEVILPDD